MRSGFVRWAFPLLAIALFAGCQEKYGYTHIEDTLITKDALTNHSTVKVVYASGGPDMNEEVDYLFRYTVVINGTTDTVNVLSPLRTKISAEDDVRKFIAARSEETDDRALLEAAFKGKKPVKIVSNNPYKHLEKNEHPTVLGLLIFPDTQQPVVQ